LRQARETLGDEQPIQGNLDPISLLAPRREELAYRTQEVLKQAEGHPAYIFNLGHGILPSTPIENVRWLVDYVHEYKGDAD